jgi:hypothetical protein
MGQPVLSLDEVLLALKAHTRTSEGNYKAQCPAHDDRTASLSVKRGDKGGVLLKCFAGCSYQSIVSAIGLAPSQLMPPKGLVPAIR